MAYGRAGDSGSPCRVARPHSHRHPAERRSAETEDARRVVPRPGVRVLNRFDVSDQALDVAGLDEVTDVTLPWGERPPVSGGRSEPDGPVRIASGEEGDLSGVFRL